MRLIVWPIDVRILTLRYQLCYSNKPDDGHPHLCVEVDFSRRGLASEDWNSFFGGTKQARKRRREERGKGRSKGGCCIKEKDGTAPIVVHLLAINQFFLFSGITSHYKAYRKE